MKPIHAGAEYADVLAALHTLSFAAPWRAAEFDALLRQPGVAAWMWQEAAPEGFILVRAAADEAEILTLAVSPAQRRKGIAGKLMDAAMDTLRAGGTARMFLEVAADNAAAQALYARCGFIACGRRPDYYGSGTHGKAVDAIVMTRDL